jgi:hypothetical protein
MIASTIATMLPPISPFALAPNSAGRTSWAECRVDMTTPAPRGSTRTGPLAAQDRDASKPDLVAVRHRLPDDPERLRRQVTVDVIGRVEIDRVDLVAVHKTVEVDDLRGLDLEVLQLVIGDRDIAPAFELVAFDNPITIDNLAGLGVDELLRHTLPVSGLN